MIACGHLDALERKPHRPLKCASLGQHADIDFAAVIGGDRVQLAMAHGDLIKIILIALL